MKFYYLILTILFAGCAQQANEQQPLPVKQTPQANDSNMMSAQSKYYDEELVKSVNHYAKWLMQDLFSNIDYPDNNDVYVVTNFALLDSNLNKTNHFGRQMAEAIMHEVHKTGFSVIDLKASGFLRMTETGDVFYQTSDYLELSPATDASHVITGTMTKHQGGYLINAKAILLENKALISSAQIFVPHKVVDAVMLEEKELKAEQETKVAKKTSMQLKAYSNK